MTDGTSSVQPPNEAKVYSSVATEYEGQELVTCEIRHLENDETAILLTNPSFLNPVLID